MGGRASLGRHERPESPSIEVHELSALVAVATGRALAKRQWPKIVLSCSLEPNPNIAVFQALFCPATLGSPLPVTALPQPGAAFRPISSLISRLSTRIPPRSRRPPRRRPATTRSRGESCRPGRVSRPRRGDPPVRIEPVVAAIERKMRIIGRHVSREAGNLGRRDVRRVGDNHVELAGERTAPIRGDERGTSRNAEAVRIGFCQREGIDRYRCRSLAHWAVRRAA